MSAVNKLILKYEEQLTDFIQWQIDHQPTSDYSFFAEHSCSQIDLPKYAALLYKEYLEIEGVLVWKDHFNKENWEKWRETRSPIETANVLNHVHIDMLPFNQNNNEELINLSGELLAFFWNQSLKAQFPEKISSVKFEEDQVYLEQKSG